jgi:hypothetical protein
MRVQGDPLARLRARGLLALTEQVAGAHHVLVDEIVGRSRTRNVVRARHALCRELRALGLSSTETGAVLGLDHTTVLAACRPRKNEAPGGDDLRGLDQRRCEPNMQRETPVDKCRCTAEVR